MCIYLYHSLFFFFMEEEYEDLFFLLILFIYLTFLCLMVTFLYTRPADKDKENEG